MHSLSRRAQDWQNRSGSTTCNSSQQCNRLAFGWVEDEPLPRHRWNPFALTMTFEFISSAFALFYLRELAWAPPALRLACRYAPIGWSLLGLALYLGWFVARGQDNWCEVLAVLASHGLAVWVLARYDAWRAEFEETALRGLASTFARRFYMCYVSGYPWRIPARVGADDDVLEQNGFSHSAAETSLKQRLAVLLRYGEYTITASLLYVAVLSIFVVGPPSWAFVVGFAGIWTCNAMGAALHLMHTELALGPVISGAIISQVEPDPEPAEREHARAPAVWVSPFLAAPIVCAVTLARSGPMGAPPAATLARSGPMGAPPAETPASSPPGGWGKTAAAILGVGTWHDHWVSRLEMLKGAWLGLMAGMLVIVYFGQGYLFNASMPAFVLFTLWNLLLLYCAFGLVATLFYTFDRYWQWLEPALDMLSVCAKVPIAASVCVAFTQMPGGAC